MPTLLKIDVSPRGDYSISRKLGTQFADQWILAHVGGKIITRDLIKTDLPYVDLPWIMGAFTDPFNHNDEQKAALKIGDDLIEELKEATDYLISTPMYNYSTPARLKGYIDHIVRAGKTFNPNPDGSYTGLLTGKKVTVIIASAAEYKPGTPTEGDNTETPYLRLILKFMGVTDVTFIEAGSTWKVDKGMEKADALIAPFADQIAAAANR